VRGEGWRGMRGGVGWEMRGVWWFGYLEINFSSFRSSLVAHTHIHIHNTHTYTIHTHTQYTHIHNTQHTHSDIV
jgi:hypothetical protein